MSDLERVTIYTVGNYEIEWPTAANGRRTEGMAFVIPGPKARTQNSQFVTLYGNGEWAADNPGALPNSVRAKLRILSRLVATGYRCCEHCDHAYKEKNFPNNHKHQCSAGCND